MDDLRRLRARTGREKPVTDGQATHTHTHTHTHIRIHVRAAAAVLSTLADSGRTLADLQHTEH